MVATDNFRSSLHGFNRTDVVQFIQQQTAAHERSMCTLKEENLRLQTALDELRAENERLTAQNEALTLEVEAVRLAMLEEKPAPVEETAPVEEPAPVQAPVAETPVLDTPIAPVQTVVATAPSDFNELELAAYRRAEMTERMARERAAASVNRMKMIFTQTDEKLSVGAQDLKIACDAIRNDYEQLQQVLAALQGIVDESTAGLKSAADICEEN